MATTTRHPSLGETEVAARVKDLLRTLEVDTKRFDEDIRLTTEKIPKLEPSILAASNLEILEGVHRYPPLPESEFARLARLALERVTLTIGPPVPVDRSAHLNGGEVAIVPVTVFNSCGLPLRDLALRMEAVGPVTVRQFVPPGLRRVNPQYLVEMQPGDRRTLHFFIQANQIPDPMTAKLHVHLLGEVVPFVAHSPVYGSEFEILPAD